MEPLRSEIVVLGGGPTGCTLATLLARDGRDVLVVEAEATPRKVVGESLLPAGNRVLDLLGVDRSGFLSKTGAVFSRGEERARVDFREVTGAPWVSAHQVKREEFDARFRKLAQDAGARWLHARAVGADLPGRLETTAGTVEAEWILDAAGRATFLARQLGIRKQHPKLRNAALVRYYRGVRELPPYEMGDIVAGSFEGGWFWLIPFADGEWSVGVVTTSDADVRGDRWTWALERAPDIRARLEGAELLDERGGVQDFTARADRFHGDGWALVGDAALFLDPIFSTGVLLGTESAARFVDHFRAGTLDAYEAEFRQAAGIFEKVVTAFYEETFLDIILAPRALQPEKYRRAIITLMAGYVFDDPHPDALAIADRFPQAARHINKQMPERVRR